MPPTTQEPGPSPAESPADVATDLPADIQVAVDAAVQRVDALVAADPNLVHGDAVEAVALELPVEVAVPLCQQTMSFVPDTVRARVFEAENAEAFRRSAEARAQREEAEQRTSARSAKAAATRAASAAAEAAEAAAAVRSATCPTCFQVRSATGICGCD